MENVSEQLNTSFRSSIIGVILWNFSFIPFHNESTEKSSILSYFSLIFLAITALRIHISLEMKLALDALGGFNVESRGMTDIKVKNRKH